MKIQLNTDSNVNGTEKLESIVIEKVNHGLKHFAHKISRVEVHLSDQNADKKGPDDIQCKIEARIEGRQPVLVTSTNNSNNKAIDEAIDKLKASLRTVFGKMKNK